MSTDIHLDSTHVITYQGTPCLICIEDMHDVMLLNKFATKALRTKLDYTKAEDAAITTMTQVPPEAQVDPTEDDISEDGQEQLKQLRLCGSCFPCVSSSCMSIKRPTEHPKWCAPPCSGDRCESGQYMCLECDRLSTLTLTPSNGHTCVVKTAAKAAACGCQICCGCTMAWMCGLPVATGGLAAGAVSLICMSRSK